MISTKYRKQQKERAKEIIAAKRASKDPTKKDKIKGNKKDHRVRMARRDEKIKQRGLKRIAHRKQQIEKLKAIIEENKKLEREKENGVEEKPNEIGEVYQGLLNQENVKPNEYDIPFSPTPLDEDVIREFVGEGERHVGPGCMEFIGADGDDFKLNPNSLDYLTGEEE